MRAQQKKTTDGQTRREIHRERCDARGKREETHRDKFDYNKPRDSFMSCFISEYYECTQSNRRYFQT